MLTHAAFKFELDPNNVQAGQMAGHCRAAKIAWNWMLSQVKADLVARAANPDHVSVGWSAPSLRKAWNEAKRDIYPDWHHYSKETYSSAATGLALALDNWSQSKKGLRRGREMGFPKFRGRVDSYTITTGVFGVRDLRHVRIPIVGQIRTKESTGKLMRLLDAGKARILRATVSTHAGRWFVSFNCEVEREALTPTHPESTVGVDVGISRLATIVNDQGEVIARVAAPKPLKAHERRLRRYQRCMKRRQGPDRKKGQRASKRYRRQKAKVSRLHRRIADTRADACHKLTANLVRTHGKVVVEKLSVTGMTRNRRLAKAVADSGLARIRPQVAYKAPWYGSTCVQADRWYPSSKLCSACGAKNDQLQLRHRRWACVACGVEHDRDDNAGLNLARYLVQERTASAAGTGADGSDARGEDVRPRPARRPSWKREARTAPAGKASSVPTQGGTAWPENSHEPGNGNIFLAEQQRLPV